MNRRTFLQDSAFLAGALCLDLPTFAKKIKSFGKVKLRIGILSDIHIRDEKTTEPLKRAFEYFREQNADGVIIAGDIADFGLEHQLALAAKTWYDVFPNDKAPDGHTVEKLFVYGNHDMEGYNYGRAKQAFPDESYRQKQKMCDRRAEIWETYFHETWQPIYLKQIKGYSFVGGHFDNYKNMPGLREFLQANHDKIADKQKPFFYIQHTHPKDTCSAPFVWGQDGGEVTEILSAYPNAIAFSGHSHYPLTDDRTLWQGAFTSIGTASLSYVYPIGARENSEVYKVPELLPAQMGVMNYYEGKHGMLMTIYNDYITIERKEFEYGETLGDNWVIPLPHMDGSSPLSFENRAKKAVAPQFMQGAKATITYGIGKNRKKEEKQQVTVHFPSVLKKNTGVRAFDYEVQVELQDEDVVKTLLTKRVFSPGSILGENHDEKEVICVFAADELPKRGKKRFAVRPCECFGKKGEPIYTEWFVETEK